MPRRAQGIELVEEDDDVLFEPEPDAGPGIVVSDEGLQGRVEAEPGEIECLAGAARSDGFMSVRRKDGLGVRGGELVEIHHRVPRHPSQDEGAGSMRCTRIGCRIVGHGTIQDALRRCWGPTRCRCQR